jgi:hypothetical protein
MKMKKNNEGNFRTFWFKYSAYDKVDLDEKYYITPKENSKVTMYDPFDVADNILVDILTIGLDIKKTDMLSAENRVMEFVHNYGLLGELTYAPINSNLVVQQKVFLPSDNVITEKEEEMSTEDYIKLFLKCEKKQKININKLSDGSIELTVENEMNPIAAIDRPAEYAVVFSKAYSERIIWIMQYARDLYSVFEAIENYNKVEDAYTKQLYDRRIKNFNPSKIACRILMDPNKENPPVIEWNFNSLKLAIDTMFALNETTERQTVKMCKHCGKPFASDNLKAEYCSPQCRNQANVYKSRAKKATNIELT